MRDWYAVCMSEQITFRIPNEDLARLDEIVANRGYPTRAEAIRSALRLLVRTERNRLIAESYRQAYAEKPQEDWIGEAGAAALSDAISGEGGRDVRPR